MKSDPFKIQEGLVKDSKLKGFSENKNSGDYFDFVWEKSTQTLGRFFAENQSSRLFKVLLVVLFILFTRAFYLQIIQGDKYRDRAEGNRIRHEIVRANRGLIYDRNGVQLVKNVSHFFLYLWPDRWLDDKQKQDTLKQLSEVLAIPQSDIEERLQEAKKGEKVLVFENVVYEKAIQLILAAENNPSLEVSYEPRREYFPQFGLSHELGYLGVVSEKDLAENKNYNYNDRLGKTGLEHIYEDFLRGQDGFRQIEVDALNRAKNSIGWQEPKDGQDIVLTIDSSAQSQLYSVMAKNAASFGKNKMAAVVLDANDGGVLAMVSLPSFDNNIFTSALKKEEYSVLMTDPNTPLLNRVVSGEYPFGSVFKPVVAGAALEEKVIDQNFTVQSTGGVQIGNNFFPDWRPAGHGRADIKWALADSVNTFFYTIGGGNNQWLDKGLGMERILQYAAKFGFGSKTKIDLSNEAEGFLPSQAWKEKTFNDRWYLGDTYNLSIGQGYLLGTPLQVAVEMSYFATGKSWQPHLLKGIKKEASLEEKATPVLLENLLSQNNLDIIRQGLRETVEIGTAKSLQSVKVPVAGKTGTAQFNHNKTPHSWFASFAPYDKPQIVMVVLVEEGGDTGLAVTVSRQFMEWYFNK